MSNHIWWDFVLFWFNTDINQRACNIFTFICSEFWLILLLLLLLLSHKWGVNKLFESIVSVHSIMCRSAHTYKWIMRYPKVRWTDRPGWTYFSVFWNLLLLVLTLMSGLRLKATAVWDSIGGNLELETQTQMTPSSNKKGKPYW